jgi:hypothetical protein
VLPRPFEPTALTGQVDFAAQTVKNANIF